MKKNLLNLVDIEDMPFALQEEFTRSKLNIPPHVWDKYDSEIRGKCIATEIVRSRIEFVERFHREIDNNIQKNKPKT